MKQKISSRQIRSAIFLGLSASIVATAFSLSASGQSTGSNEPLSSPGAAREVYAASLSPLNGSGASASIQIVVDSGQVGASIQAQGLAPNVVHIQEVYSGSTCPTSANDLNGDNYIDAIENRSAAGSADVPLILGQLGTANGSASATSTNYPFPSPNGTLYYISSGLLSSVYSQAQALISQPLPIPFPSISPSSMPSGMPSGLPSSTPSVNPVSGAAPTALPSGLPASATGNGQTQGQALFDGKVVVISGVDPSMVNLPSTVVAGQGTTAAQSLPIACGVLTPVSQ